MRSCCPSSAGFVPVVVFYNTMRMVVDTHGNPYWRPMLGSGRNTAVMRKGVILLYFLVILNYTSAQVGLISKQEPEWRIINSYYELDPKGNGKYTFGFVGTDGIKREEIGGFDDNQNYVVTGEYSYYDEDGNFHKIKYMADKDGYRVIPPPLQQGPALSLSPFTSPRIVAALLG